MFGWRTRAKFEKCVGGRSMNLLQSQKIEGQEVEEKEEIVGERVQLARLVGQRGGGGRVVSVCRGRAWVSMFRRQLPCAAFLRSLSLDSSAHTRKAALRRVSRVWRMPGRCCVIADI